jgi:hypothetical protein
MTAGPQELLLFQVGARVFAAPAADVRRIGSALLEREEEGVPESALGSPWDARRGLVVDAGGGSERIVLVDSVLGLRLAQPGELRELPAFAREVMPTRAIAALALFDEVPTLVVDLSTLVREQERRGAAREETTDHA